MISLKIRGLIAAGAFALAVPAAQTATAQYANSPFFDWTVVVSQAYGLEMAEARLDVLDAIEGPVDPDLIEVVEQMAKGDWARFGGTLTERNPELAADLYEYLAAFEETLEDGESADDLIAPTRELLAQAYDIVIDPAIRNTPAFKGAIIARLLLGEGGVSEGYDEAAQEIFAYSMGWATLQRVKALWADVEGPATADQKDEATQLLGILDALYPEAAPPEEWVGRNPEEAESPSQLLLGIVESATNASLYAGRDLPGLAGHLAEVVAPACTALEAGQDAIATEIMYAAADHFLGETTGLADLVGMFAPELQVEGQEIFALFVVPDDDVDEDADAPAAAGAEEEEYEYGPEACHALVDTLNNAKTALGG